MTLGPWQWKHRVLTTGLSGKSPLSPSFLPMVSLSFLSQASVFTLLSCFFLKRYLYHIAVYLKNIYLFILAAAGLRCSLREVLVTTCGEWCPDQGLNRGLLHWESGVLATGPPGKSRFLLFHISLPLFFCLFRTSPLSCVLTLLRLPFGSLYSLSSISILYRCCSCAFTSSCVCRCCHPPEKLTVIWGLFLN